MYMIYTIRYCLPYFVFDTGLTLSTLVLIIAYLHRTDRYAHTLYNANNPLCLAPWVVYCMCSVQLPVQVNCYYISKYVLYSEVASLTAEALDAHIIGSITIKRQNLTLKVELI